MQIKKLKPKIRYLAEIKEALFDQKWVKTAPDLKLYYMYRDLADNKEEKDLIHKHGLRYDITIIPFIILGQEFNKTAGHDHPIAPNSNLTYPEIYQVLHGQAIFLLQDSKRDNIKDVYAIKAKKGDKIIVPPNYEHLIINASGKELQTANWICNNFESNIYKPFRQKRGFCYYALKSNTGEINWVKNKNYDLVPDLRFKEPNLWLDKFNIDKNKEMYHLVNDLKKLDFLKNPGKYDWK